MDSSTQKTTTEKTKTTTESSATSTIIVVCITIGFICFCCLLIGAYCFYKRKREKQVEQIAAGVPTVAPNQLNAQPAVSPVFTAGQPQVIVIKGKIA